MPAILVRKTRRWSTSSCSHSSVIPRSRAWEGQRAQDPQHVGGVLGVSRLAVLGEVLELGHHLIDRLALQQVPQVGLTEQLAEEGRIEGECGGAPLGQRRVTLVEVLPHVPEQQGAREGRRCGGVDSMTRILRSWTAAISSTRAGRS